ncbi:MAG: lysophospholipid acyltransferase family protein [Propionicimonas sp.]|nr:lysophospholipid acyltransferase family protein [Propionicimonas sp.]
MYEFFKTVLFRPVVKWLMRATLAGAENVPATGGAVLAINHPATSETYVLPAMLERTLTFPAKAELFRGDRGPGSKVVAWFMKAIKQVPLDRSGGRMSLEGLRPILQVLADGGLVGIFPEGTRSPDGRLYKGKTGVARIALLAGVPIIPVAVFDTATVRTRLGIPWVRRPRLVVGEPLDFSAYSGRADDPAVMRWVTNEVMAAIQELSGQEYVDVYAGSVKHGAVSAADADAKVLPRPNTGATPPPLPATNI